MQLRHTSAISSSSPVYFRTLFGRAIHAQDPGPYPQSLSFLQLCAFRAQG